jgi:hypothetical protein
VTTTLADLTDEQTDLRDMAERLARAEYASEFLGRRFDHRA